MGESVIRRTPKEMRAQCRKCPIVLPDSFRRPWEASRIFGLERQSCCNSCQVGIVFPVFSHSKEDSLKRIIQNMSIKQWNWFLCSTI